MASNRERIRAKRKAKRKPDARSFQEKPDPVRDARRAEARARYEREVARLEARIAENERLRAEAWAKLPPEARDAMLKMGATLAIVMR